MAICEFCYAYGLWIVVKTSIIKFKKFENLNFRTIFIMDVRGQQTIILPSRQYPVAPIEFLLLMIFLICLVDSGYKSRFYLLL